MDTFWATYGKIRAPFISTSGHTGRERPFEVVK